MYVLYQCTYHFKVLDFHILDCLQKHILLKSKTKLYFRVSIQSTSGKTKYCYPYDYTEDKPDWKGNYRVMIIQFQTRLKHENTI